MKSLDFTTENSEKLTVIDKLQKSKRICEIVKCCKIKLSRRLRRRVVGSLCAVTMLATTLASAVASPVYAEVIKRNATESTTAMAQNYLNKGISSLADLSYSKILSNGSRYSFITDATLLPTLYSNWRANDIDSWYFYDSDGSVKTGWLYDNGWYYLSTEDEGIAGLMKYGWYKDSEGSWYFLNTVHDGTFGRAVSGWQWIDGYSYYFDENCRLVVSGSTTDGYTVDSDGRWTVDGVAQYVEGKGLTTQLVYLDNNTASSVASDSTSTSDDYNSNSSSSSSDSGTASGDNTDSTKTDSTDSDSTSKDEKDTDGDGVPDWLEEYLGTSSTASDTDGDGISDYDEIYIIGSDPIVNDSNEDADSDGISNFDEINVYKTDPTSKDTDGDGISDYDEIFVHHTDPLKADTDGDGISDADEIKYGFDPLMADSDGNGTPDGQESITITATYDGESIAQPTAQITLQAGVAASVNIERDDPETSIWMTEDVPGMLDAMYDFTVDGEIEEATLIFSFTEDESADFYPAIYYVDTENQEMTELENQVVDWEAKTVTATTNHFSGYVALNKVEQDRAWAVDIKDKSDSAGAGTKLDIAFVIDESRTMSTSDPDRSRVDIARDIIDTLVQGDRVSIIGFDTEERLYQPLTDKLAVARQSLLAIQNGTVAKYMTLSGGIWAGLYSLVPDSTVWNSAMINETSIVKEDLMVDATSINEEMAIDISAMFDEAIATPSEAKGELATASQAHEDSEHVLATVSDAHEDREYATDMQSQFPYVLANASDTTDETMKLIVLMTDGKNVAHAFAYQGAIEAGVKIHVLQIGEGGYTILLKNIAEYTGGNYYNQNEADRLIDDIKASVAIDIKIDSDQDGLSDYHEERIRIFTGEIISLNKYRADTDGDGLLDGEEIIMTKNGNGSVYFKMKSNPNMLDSDGDLDQDNIDPSPMDFQLNDLLSQNICKLYKLAVEYSIVHNDNMLPFDTSVYYRLTFMFIRQFNSEYIGNWWPGVGGIIDNDFVEYVKENDIELYTYFKNTNTFYATTDGQVGDLYHMVATMTAHIFDSNLAYPSFDIKYVAPDEIIDNLAGWAGDLQTAMIDARIIAGEDADYTLFKETMKNLIGYDIRNGDIYSGYTHSFDIEDVYADIDARNIYGELSYSKTIESVLDEYYKNGYKKRYTTFADSLGITWVAGYIHTYTRNSYYIIQWLIFANRLGSNVKFSEDQSLAARDAFAEFLEANIDIEKGER